MPAGKYANPRRKITAPKEDFDRWDRAAAERDLTWSQLVVFLLDVVAPPPKESTEPPKKVPRDA